MADMRSLARKHETELRAFRRKLFSEAADSTEWVASSGLDQMPALARFGPVRSTTNRHADLTVVGDTVDLAVMVDDPTQTGTIITLSVAAHHRVLRTRLPVDGDDAAAWIGAILGDEWAAHAHAGGALSTTETSGEATTIPRLTTQYFYVFLTADGQPQTPPAQFSVRTRPLLAR